MSPPVTTHRLRGWSPSGARMSYFLDPGDWHALQAIMITHGAKALRQVLLPLDDKQLATVEGATLYPSAPPQRFSLALCMNLMDSVVANAWC